MMRQTNEQPTAPLPWGTGIAAIRAAVRGMAGTFSARDVVAATGLPATTYRLLCVAEELAPLVRSGEVTVTGAGRSRRYTRP